MKKEEVIKEVIKDIKEKASSDIWYLLTPERYKEETFPEYKIRMKLATKYLRVRKKGVLFHVSKEDMSHILEAAKKAGIKGMPKITGITYVNTSPKTFKSDEKRKINN